jgi:hypothetical protein
MESFEYYIIDQCNKAIKDKAPATAIYYGTDYTAKGHPERWHTLEEVKEATTRVQLRNIAKSFKH